MTDTLKKAWLPVFCLLGGVLITIAVAWACVLQPGVVIGARQVFYDRGDAATARGWPAAVPSDWPLPTDVAEWRCTGISVRTADIFAGNDPKRDLKKYNYFGVTVHRAGWPFLALRCTRFSPGSIDGRLIPGFGSLKFQSLEAGLLYDRRRPDGVAYVVGWIPLRPTLGFVADTAFYALLLWLPNRGLLLARTLLRRRRGACLACGYSLVGAAHSVCPECGLARTPV